MVLWNRVYTMGITIRVRKVELTNPPITTVASYAPIIPLLSSVDRARGRRAKVVVKRGSTAKETVSSCFWNFSSTIPADVVRAKS